MKRPAWKQSSKHPKNAFSFRLSAATQLRKLLLKQCLEDWIMRLVEIHKLNYHQCRGFKDFWSFTIWEMKRGETWAGGAGGQRAVTPCWWFIWHTKICSLGSTFKTSHALWLTAILRGFLSSSTITHTAGLKNIPSAVKEQHNTIQCCSPGCTCDKELEKYWHSQRQRSVPTTFVRWCYMFVHASVSGSNTKEERDSGSELHRAGQDLGHSQDFLMESGCSLTHDTNISSNHY